METKKSKYDTNPLDPEFEKNTEETWGQTDSGPVTQQVGGVTRQVNTPQNEGSRQNVYSEAPTRRYDNVQADAPYPSVFIPPTYAPPAQQQPMHAYQPGVSTRPTSRSIAGVGVPENWAMMLPYAPYIGVVVSLLELFLVPRKEVRVRFHASQALALHVAFIVIQTIFGIIGSITASSIGGSLFKLATFIFLIVSMIRVWQGKPHRIEPLSDPAQWFNDHIEPRNQG